MEDELGDAKTTGRSHTSIDMASVLLMAGTSGSALVLLGHSSFQEAAR